MLSVSPELRVTERRRKECCYLLQHQEISIPCGSEAPIDSLFFSPSFSPSPLALHTPVPPGQLSRCQPQTPCAMPWRMDFLGVLLLLPLVTLVLLDWIRAPLLSWLPSQQVPHAAWDTLSTRRWGAEHLITGDELCEHQHPRQGMLLPLNPGSHWECCSRREFCRSQAQ